MRDFYGRLRAAQNGNPMDAPMVYEIDAETTDETTIRYIRFESSDEPIAIWKETEIKDADGNLSYFKREFAMAKWEDRAKNTTTYVPINKCWEV